MAGQKERPKQNKKETQEMRKTQETEASGQTGEVKRGEKCRKRDEGMEGKRSGQRKENCIEGNLRLAVVEWKGAGRVTADRQHWEFWCR